MREILKLLLEVNVMKDKLYGIGSILVGIMGLYGLYKAFYKGVSWMIDFILDGISKFRPDKGED